MNDNDLFSHDDIERMLMPRYSFRASDSLKSRIAGKVSATPRKRYRRLLPWTAAACAAAVIAGVLFLPGTIQHHAPESEIRIASASQHPAPATQPDVAPPAETPSIAEAPLPGPAAKRRQPVHKPDSPAKDTGDDDQIIDVIDGYHELFYFDVADLELFNTDDFSYGDDVAYAMIDETEPNTFPMKTTPEERIRMQREESLEYLDRVRQEIQECRDLYLHLHSLQ